MLNYLICWKFFLPLSSLLQADFYFQISYYNFHSDVRRNKVFVILNRNFLNHHLYQWHPHFTLNSKALSRVPSPYINICFWIFLFGHLPGYFPEYLPNSIYHTLKFSFFCQTAHTFSAGQTVARPFPQLLKSENWMSRLPSYPPFTTLLITQQVLSSIPPKYLLKCQLPTIISAIGY